MSAVAVEFAAPLLLFWTPGLGASRTSDWTVNGAHMAERCALFIIIALGESLLLAGSTFTAVPWALVGGAGLLSAFAATAGMWWIYFHEGAEHAARQIAASSDPGNTARISHSFLHIPIVAGVIVAAVGNSAPGCDLGNPGAEGPAPHPANHRRSVARHNPEPAPTARSEPSPQALRRALPLRKSGSQ